MSIFDTLLGNTAADASKGAASDTYQKQMGAIGQLNAFGDQYADKFAGLAKGYDPYVATGNTANTSLQQLLADPSSVRSLPGYQFSFDQGMNAVDRGAAARSGVQNGSTIKAEQRFGTGLADQTYGSQLQRLLGLSQFGAGALGQQNATIGQGLQGQLGTRTAGFNGQMQAAGTIGQGDVAAANAQTAGIQNLLNFGGNLAGKAMGGFGGGGSSFTGGNGLSGAMGYAASGTNPFASDGSRNPYYGNG
jgi:hypothetical protein